MSICFIDSSALVKRYRHEVGSNRLSALMKATDQMLIARLTIVEVSSALVRRAQESKTSGDDFGIALDIFDAEVDDSFDVVELERQVIDGAVHMARKHALRGADAIQLACALLSRAELPGPPDFYLVSADDELNAAAAAEGLRVENPNLHP